MLKIAHIAAYPYRGGTQEYAIGLSKAQKKLGHDTSIFFVGQESQNDATQYHFKRPLMNLFRNPISLDFSLSVFKVESHYDILHIHLPFPLTGDFAVVLIQLLKSVKTKSSNAVVATYHFDIDLESPGQQVVANIYNNSLLDVTLRFTDLIIVSSDAFLKNSRILAKYREKVAVIPMGINTSLYKPSYFYPSRIVFVGRIIPEKGIDYLIKAMTYLDPKSELVIAGKIVDVTYFEELKNLCKSLNLSQRVKFTGYISQRELLKIYEDCQVVVLPSTTRLESFGITLLEALATGKPIIASEIIPGAVELIEKSGCGFKVSRRNPLAIADAIQKNQLNSEAIGRQARRYVEKNHDWAIVAKRTVQVYEDVLRKKNAGF